jgi:23S rRNA pseudouridine2605 synthase
MPEERLQKVLARAGISSRRSAEELILKGRVSVDGKIVRELGVRADSRHQRIEVDGRRIVAEPFVYLILNKPRAVMCTLSDPEGRQTIADLIRGVGSRVVPVGRLDYHTSGALLLTNDGDFALKLQHPSGMVPKEYVAKVRGVLNEDSIERFSRSIEIDGRRTQPADVRLLRVEGDKTWLSITLHEGKNRQVRRLGEDAGFPVLRLSRLAQAGISTEGLRPGEWRMLSREELTELKKAYGVPHRVRGPEPLDERSAARRAPPPRPQLKPARPAGVSRGDGPRGDGPRGDGPRGSGPFARGDGPRPAAAKFRRTQGDEASKPARAGSGRGSAEAGRGEPKFGRAESGRARSEGGRGEPRFSRTEGSRGEPKFGRAESGRGRAESGRGRAESGRGEPKFGRAESGRGEPKFGRAESGRGEPKFGRAEGGRGEPRFARGDGQRAAPKFTSDESKRSAGGRAAPKATRAEQKPAAAGRGDAKLNRGGARGSSTRRGTSR